MMHEPRYRLHHGEAIVINGEKGGRTGSRSNISCSLRTPPVNAYTWMEDQFGNF